MIEQRFTRSMLACAVTFDLTRLDIAVGFYLSIYICTGSVHIGLIRALWVLRALLMKMELTFPLLFVTLEIHWNKSLPSLHNNIIHRLDLST